MKTPHLAVRGGNWPHRSARRPRLRARAGLSEQADPRHHRQQRRRHERHLRARARRRTAEAARPADHRGEPLRRRHEHRRPRLLRSAQRRLQHLHPAERGADAERIHLQVDPLQSGKGLRPDHQLLHQHPGAGGERARSASTRWTSSPRCPRPSPARCPTACSPSRCRSPSRTGRRRPAPTSSWCRRAAAATW